MDPFRYYRAPISCQLTCNTPALLAAQPALLATQQQYAAAICMLCCHQLHSNSTATTNTEFSLEHPHPPSQAPPVVTGSLCVIAAVFNRDYKTQLRGRWTTLQEQYSWWGRAETGRGSTLNAVLASKYDEGEQAWWDLHLAHASLNIRHGTEHTPPCLLRKLASPNYMAIMLFTLLTNALNTLLKVCSNTR